MKRLIILADLLVMLVGLLLSGIADSDASIADTSVPGDEAASSQSEANNSSASATITITMYTLPTQ